MTTIAQLLQNPFVQRVGSIAADSGADAYLVGGAVRDGLLGKTSVQDLDFVLGDGFEAVVQRFARTSRGKVIPWDIDQQRVVFKHAGAYVTADFSRRKPGGIMHDLTQRDFTVNAIAVAISTDEVDEPRLIDPLGGRNDLAARRLRMCSPDAFEADPLRMLRAIRFARQLACSIDPQTFACIAQNRKLISRCARERIKRELFMILQLPDPAQSVRELLASGLLAGLIPVVGQFAGVQQSRPHQHNLLEHSLQTVQQLADVLRVPDARVAPLRTMLEEYLNFSLEDGVTRLSLLVFAALLHDVGKTASFRFDAGAIRFIGHEKIGASIARQLARDIGLGKKAALLLAGMVENHMRIMQLSQLDTVSERAKGRFVRDCSDAALAVCLLAVADAGATSTHASFAGQKRCVETVAYDIVVRMLSDACPLETEPLLTGADVIELPGVREGPAVGKILRQAAQLERDGILHSRDDALLWLRRKNSTD